LAELLPNLPISSVGSFSTLFSPDGSSKERTTEMRCPGQDKRYWSGGAIFEVPCPKCGADVEIFQDESSGRCTKCKHKFKNPKRDLKCAEWCAYAEECLGYAPKKTASQDALSHNLGEGALASRLLQAAKDSLAGEQEKITRALVVFQHARALAAVEGGDSRVIMAAAVLMEVGRCEEGKDGPEDLMAVTKILREMGLDAGTVDNVCEIIDNWRAGRPLDSIEFKVVSDSQAMARFMPCEGTDGPNPKHLEELIGEQLVTDAAKQRTRKLFQL
jgi:DNA-directed RNA polymerase subunit RPC12/RpoP